MKPLLILLFAVGTLAQITPVPCSTMGFECVGEGLSCNTDLVGGWQGGCDNTETSLCRICGDADLVCHNGQCLRRTQGVGQSCNEFDREYCIYSLNCQGGICVDPVTSSASNFAGFDEPCETTSDCISGLTCDPFLKKCRLLPPEPYTCSSDATCPSGYFCSLQDTTTTPTIPRQCKKAIPLGSREGALCTRPEGGAEENSLECGYVYSCQQLNPFEDDSRFVRRVCVPFYSQAEGRLCASNRFCASGKCENNYCADYDSATLGSGCRGDTDCGRFLTCACPAEGGGRERCVPDNEILTLNQNREEYERQKGYLKCLEDKGCQYLHAFLGTCGWNNCRSHLTGLTYTIQGGNYVSNSDVYTIRVSRALAVPLPKCKAYDSEYPDYKGSVCNAAIGSFQGSMVTLVLALFALLGVW